MRVISFLRVWKCLPHCKHIFSTFLAGLQGLWAAAWERLSRGPTLKHVLQSPANDGCILPAKARVPEEGSQ